MDQLTSSRLKETLWKTMTKIADGEMRPEEGNAVAAQAREILRTVKIQLQVVAQSGRSVPSDVITFAEK